MESITRQFLRHTVATVAYRGAKPIAGAPDDFAAFKASPTTKTPLEILSHLSDLFDWALTMAKGDTKWNDAKPLSWLEESERFFKALKTFDEFLAGDEELQAPPERLFQGPIADALTHIGQLAMLRRIHGAPMKGENYFKAEVEIGRVGADQSANRIEFD
jgi:hypothetical protein